MDFSEQTISYHSPNGNTTELPSSSSCSSVDELGLHLRPLENTYSLGVPDTTKNVAEYEQTADDMDEIDFKNLFNMPSTNSPHDSLQLNLDDWLAEEPILDFARGPDGNEQTSSSDEVHVTTTSTNEAVDEVDEEDEQPLKEYGLRPQARANRAEFWTTWMDQDDTGNYGERKTWKELRDERLRRAKLIQRKRDHMTFASDDGVNSEGSDEVKPGEIPKLEVTLKFASEAVRRAFCDLTSQAALKDSEHFEGYKLRTRPFGKSSEHEHTDLTGHPSARGCHACLQLDIRCPLLDDEAAWPCHTCTLDDEGCELIVPPTVKRACQRCKSRRTACSFISGTEQGEACQECMEAGHRCIASPAKDCIRPRLRYDWDWKNDPLLRKKAIKLLDAPHLPILEKQEKEKNVIDLPSIQSAPESKPSAALIEGKPNQVSTDTSRSENASGESYADFHRKRLAATKKITTKLCHPIRFNYIDKTNGKKPCHFCAEPAFPLLGLPAKQVEVIEWKDGRGLEEVRGGHKSNGVDNTRVCASCTLSRLPTITCPQHQLVPVAKVGKGVNDNAALTELLSGTMKSGTKWCSICPRLARYQCRTVSDGCECGLLLCEHDMVLLTGVYDGDLQRLLAEIKDKPSEERMFGLRADHGFLKRDGLLMKFVTWSSRQ